MLHQEPLVGRQLKTDCHTLSPKCDNNGTSKTGITPSDNNKMNAGYPYCNHACSKPLPNVEKICSVEYHERNGRNIKFNFSENGSKVKRADLVFTLNGCENYEEWHRASATLKDSCEVNAKPSKIQRLREGKSHECIILACAIPSHLPSFCMLHGELIMTV